ncbi:hypothetical protein [Rubripirellula amarantea]|uniref:hypothetical protein n=1 Tax=Rubripirellula amarantea TaxID=2527999 RepID=UPI0011B4987A|nr:hypothetical protein [Rubripirellula amarantea]
MTSPIVNASSASQQATPINRTERILKRSTEATATIAVDEPPRSPHHFMIQDGFELKQFPCGQDTVRN